MKKYFWMVILGSGVTSAVWGQIKKQFSVENPEKCERVELHLSAKTGNCFLRPSQNAALLNIYSNQDLEQYNHSFSNEVKNKTCKVTLALEEDSQTGVSQNFSYRVFGANEESHDKFWKVYLSNSLPYSLDLDYGLGNANIDLSGLSIKKLRINTGSADVNVSYSSGIENQVEMDTFYVNVDMGSLNLNQFNLSRSRVLIAEVGFGNMMMDLSDKPIVTDHIRGSVGAGNLVINLPGEETPVLVKINDSWLCSVTTCKSLHKIGNDTFANAAYDKNHKNALTFDLEVSMGKIVFKEK